MTGNRAVKNSTVNRTNINGRSAQLAQSRDSMPTRETVNSSRQCDTLPRRLGVPALVLVVVAFSAPLVTMAGFSQLCVGYGNGIGAPVSYLVAGALLLIFSVGFVGMSG